jgi:hypothetical protein
MYNTITSENLYPFWPKFKKADYSLVPLTCQLTTELENKGLT